MIQLFAQTSGQGQVLGDDVVIIRETVETVAPGVTQLPRTGTGITLTIAVAVVVIVVATFLATRKSTN